MAFRDALLALLVVLIWAGNVIAIKFAVNELPPMTAISIRFGLTALVFLPFARWPGKDLFIHMISIGLLMGVLHQGLLFLGMDYLPAGLTAILLQTQVIFSALIGLLIFSEHIGWRSWIGIILGLTGIVIMYGDKAAGFSVTGFWLLIGSTLSLSFSYMRMKKLPPIEPMTFLCLMNAIAFPFVLVFSLVLNGESWTGLGQADWTILGLVFAFQVFVVGLSHVIWQRLLSRNPMSMVTPFTILLPVFGVAMAILMLGETPTIRMLAGGLVALSGVGIVVIRRAQKNTALPRTPVNAE